MSFKDKFQSWINYSDDNYVDGVEQAADDDFDFAPGDEPAARPQPQTQPKAFRTKSNNNVVSINSPKPAPTKPSVVFQQIDKFEDVNKVADILKQKRIVVLNLENCPNDVSQRIIDVLYGVSYAGDGDFKRIAGRAYIITPNNVPVSGELGIDISDYADNL
ncbi:MAG: cell division protein SepF [Clostridia bacterium]|nr:cell division protein SepF [Clostridia bacterium]